VDHLLSPSFGESQLLHCNPAAAAEALANAISLSDADG